MGDPDERSNRALNRTRDFARRARHLQVMLDQMGVGPPPSPAELRRVADAVKERQRRSRAPDYLMGVEDGLRWAAGDPPEPGLAVVIAGFFDSENDVQQDENDHGDHDDCDDPH